MYFYCNLCFSGAERFACERGNSSTVHSRSLCSTGIYIFKKIVSCFPFESVVFVSLLRWLGFGNLGPLGAVGPPSRVDWLQRGAGDLFRMGDPEGLSGALPEAGEGPLPLRPGHSPNIFSGLGEKMFISYSL